MHRLGADGKRKSKANQFTTAHEENNAYELQSLVRSHVRHFRFKHKIYITIVTIIFIKLLRNKIKKITTDIMHFTNSRVIITTA